MNQKRVDKIARTFYATLGVAGVLGCTGFLALGVYGAASESRLNARLFFAAMAVTAVVMGRSSFRFLKYVCTHNDLPTSD